MSTQEVTKKLFSFLFWVIFLSLIISFFRQIVLYHQINKRIADREKELRQLEERNKKLNQQLKIIKEGGKVTLPLSLFSSPQSEEIKPLKSNFQKWQELFFY